MFDNDEQYTPASVFKPLGEKFDVDVAAPFDRTHICVPADRFITADSLSKCWDGFVWMNPPYSGRNSKAVWLQKLRQHGHGIGLVPDRTSSPWWQEEIPKADAILFVREKIKFIRPDGSVGTQPANGSTLVAYSERAVQALLRAQSVGFGTVFKFQKK